MKKYVEINAKTIDRWVEQGWRWGKPISHEEFFDAKNGKWEMLLTPTKPVPKNWYPKSLKGLKVLGLASGGGQQMPVFAAIGAKPTILDYSPRQIQSEIDVAKREGYQITTLRYDMTKSLPFDDETFDVIFHPVSNCYVEQVEGIFRECFRILKRGGILMCGLENGINYISSDETNIDTAMPFNPLKNPKQMAKLMSNDDGVQFSHTLSEQIGGQLKAGFILTDLYEDTNGEGRLHDLHIMTFIATRARKP